MPLDSDPVRLILTLLRNLSARECMPELCGQRTLDSSEGLRPIKAASYPLDEFPGPPLGRCNSNEHNDCQPEQA